MGKGVAVKHGVSLLAPTMILAAALLAGCSNDPASTALTNAVKERIQSATTPAAAPPVFTREQLEAPGVPVIGVKIPSRGADTVMAPRDQNSGTINWQTADGTVLTTRGGILEESRNLLPDLMSAATPTAARIATGSGSHARSYYFLGDEDATVRLDVTCTLSPVGPATLVIYGRTHATRQIRESCTGEDVSFENDFWFEGATLRQSRQWAGRQVGMVEIAHVVD